MKNIKNDEKLSILNHSCAHLMAQAIKRLYPKALFWVGPVIEEGFYYDIDLGNDVIKEDDLSNIEQEMHKVAQENNKIIKEHLTNEEALEMFKNDPYKLDLIKDIEEDITIYRQGDFIDLCRGPHLENTNELKHFKLLKVSGAYYQGDINKQMLQRVYGVCFESQDDLENHLKLLEEAKLRDHRKLGKDLDLFYFSEIVGPGLPLFTPRGTIIREELQREIESICKSYGYQKISTPHLANIKLFEISGHADKFSAELFKVTSEKGHNFALKPVLCPMHTQLYASSLRSYKDLPIRYMESEKQYRAEMPGAVGGLSRVYAISIEDGHVFCKIDQIKEEIIKIVKIIEEFYSKLSLWNEKWISLSVRDYDNLDNYIGEASDWDICEQMLEDISLELNLNAKRCEGEAALYGPKLDFMFKDAMGREIQIPTIQLDFATPKRFDLTYIDNQGNKVHPVMIHRAILGSYERFMMLLIEHFAGAFPLWLSPVQVNIIPVNNDAHLEYSNKIKAILEANNIRVEVDDRNEKLSYKMRDSQLMKNPYTLILGDKEIESKTISYRKYQDKKTYQLTPDELARMLTDEITNRK